jgi:hypothetical protein
MHRPQNGRAGERETMIDPPSPARTPMAPWVYGGLGLIPFTAGAAEIWAVPGIGSVWGGSELIGYGGLILAFLGGARFGLEIARTPVRAGVIGATMAPAVFAFLIQFGGGLVFVRWRLVLLALGFVAQWGWDVRSGDPPSWYRPLRHTLSAGAVACLLAGAVGAGPI